MHKALRIFALPGAVMVLAVLPFLVACERDSSPTVPEGKPAAFFAVTVRDTGSVFILSFTNRSSNSTGGGRENLSFAWEFQGKGQSAKETPDNREWSYTELGLSEPGDSATRTISLVVTEDDNPDRRGEHSETVVFEIPAEASSTSPAAVSVTLESETPFIYIKR